MEDRRDYESILKSRYCQRSPLIALLGERNKFILWRKLWIWLAEAEKELGLKQITEEMIEEMKANLEIFDWDEVASVERRVKHDVMAHNMCFGMVCPKAKGIIHLGATSCYVQDNAELCLQRDACKEILKSFAVCVHHLNEFAIRTKGVVTVGRTHFQSASFVTVGKRAAMWASDLLNVFVKLEEFVKNMRFRGIKGATGSQDSFLTLFHGDDKKVDALDDLVTAKAGFSKRFIICGQTYSRQQDCELMQILALFAASCVKICTDIRLLQAFGEVMEPFEEEQVGSSAMPYKRNPMKSERVCSLARALISSSETMLNTYAHQGLERTLDDSAVRRCIIPDALHSTYAILRTLTVIFQGMRPCTEQIAKNVAEELPFLALEKAMMMLCEGGDDTVDRSPAEIDHPPVDRQLAHHKIREIALAAKEEQKTRAISVEDLFKDPFFDKVRGRILEMAASPTNFAGRCEALTVRFVNEARPILEPYLTERDLNKVHVLDV